MMALKKTAITVVTRVYLEIVRIMPQMVLLFIVYFGSTKALGFNMTAETASIIEISGKEMGELRWKRYYR